MMRPVRREDIDFVLPRLRPADRAEILASTGLPAAAVMAQCMDFSDRVWALVTADGEPCALLGTQPVYDYPDFGWVWMVATPTLERNAVSFLRACRPHLPTVYGPYKALSNFVDARNTVHIRWLSWLGFKILRLVPQHGAHGLPFFEFAGIKPECVVPL